MILEDTCYHPEQKGLGEDPHKTIPVIIHRDVLNQERSPSWSLVQLTGEVGRDITAVVEGTMVGFPTGDKKQHLPGGGLQVSAHLQDRDHSGGHR